MLRLIHADGPRRSVPTLATRGKQRDEICLLKTVIQTDDDDDDGVLDSQTAVGT